MSQDSGLGGLLGSLFGGGGGGGIGKVLQDLLGGAPAGGPPAAGPTPPTAPKPPTGPLGEDQSGAIPMPGRPQTDPPGMPQGQPQGMPQGQPGMPQGMPPKPPGMGQAAAGAAAGTAGATAAAGGFGDLLDRLRNAGLGDQVDSWVGKGQNQPIDANQVTQALGPKQLHDLAEHAGLPDAAVADGLAKALPEVVDRVTPQGQIPGPTALNNNIQRLLGS